MGEVKEVKVVGVVALLDEGETDWKVIVIDVNDPLAKDINNVEDVEKHMPGLISATIDWFMYYKVPDGKDVNEIAFNGKAQNKDFALKVVEETHEAWKMLKSGKVPAKTDEYDLSIVDSKSFDDSKFVAEYSNELVKINPIDDDVDKSFYVSRAISS